MNFDEKEKLMRENLDPYSYILFKVKELFLGSLNN